MMTRSSALAGSAREQGSATQQDQSQSQGMAALLRAREQDRLAALAASREQERLRAVEKASAAGHALRAEREAWARAREQAEAAHRAEVEALRKLHEQEQELQRARVRDALGASRGLLAGGGYLRSGSVAGAGSGVDLGGGSADAIARELRALRGAEALLSAGASAGDVAMLRGSGAVGAAAAVAGRGPASGILGGHSITRHTGSPHNSLGRGRGDDECELPPSPAGSEDSLHAMMTSASRQPRGAPSVARSQGIHQGTKRANKPGNKPFQRFARWE